MMTKKERAAFDAMAAELAQLRAIHVEMNAPDKDVPVPSGWGTMAHGWLFSTYALHNIMGIRDATFKVTSESHAHYRGEHIMQRDRNAIWSQRGIASYSTRRRALLALRAERAKAAALSAEIADLRDPDARYRAFLDWRGVETPCPTCSGSGRRGYGNTSTWRRGAGGCAITDDVCDACWGTGDAERKGADLRAKAADAARERAAIVADLRTLADTERAKISTRAEIMTDLLDSLVERYESGAHHPGGLVVPT